jgi:hypothetical protein
MLERSQRMIFASSNRKQRKTTENHGGWPIAWILTKRREQKEKQSNVERLSFKLNTRDSPFSMLQAIKTTFLT